MLVKISSYEVMKKTYDQAQAAKASQAAVAEEAAKKLAGVNQEIADAQAAVNNLLDRAIAGEDLAAEFATAKSQLSIAEDKKNRIIATHKTEVPAPVNLMFSTRTVESEIRNQIGDGRIFEVFQPDLDELNELREQYRKKAQAVLVKMRQVNKELSSIYLNATQIESEVTGKMVDTRPVEQLTELDFQPWMWVNNDLHNDMAVIRRKAEQIASPTRELPPANYGGDATKAGLANSPMTGEDWVKLNKNVVRG